MNAGARDLFDLSGKVALVTGGAQGMGYMIAQGLLDAGATVYLTSRKADLARSAARELSARGACIGVQADLSSAEAATVLARWMAEREPRLHILVNNAGKTWGAKLADFPDHAWDSVMRVHVQAHFSRQILLQEVGGHTVSSTWREPVAQRTREQQKVPRGQSCSSDANGALFAIK